jgi:peptidoglycan hydrolase-like protein with peptidoglycan-binding domain
MFDVGLIAAACMIPLAPVIAQGIGAAPDEAGRGPAHDRRVQQDLVEHGFNVPVNGVMNAQTSAALRQYQQKNGLPPTGQINEETFTSLEGLAPPGPAMMLAPGAPPPG